MTTIIRHKVRKGCFEIILFYKLHHLSLEASYTVCDAEGQTSKLIKVFTSFKGCVRLIFIFGRHLMICTSEINSAEDSVLAILLTMSLTLGCSENFVLVDGPSTANLCEEASLLTLSTLPRELGVLTVSTEQASRGFRLYCS